MITATLVGDRALVERIGRVPAAVMQEVTQTVKKLGFEVEARTRSAYLRGPRPEKLGVRTGRLMSSISPGSADSRSRLEAGSTAVYYYVGTNVPYGALWEYGFAKRIGAGARGGPKTLSGKARDTYFMRHPPGVKEMAARPFLAPALADLRQHVRDELTAALGRGMQKGLGA